MWPKAPPPLPQPPPPPENEEIEQEAAQQPYEFDNAEHQLNEGDWTEPWWVGPAGDRDPVM